MWSLHSLLVSTECRPCFWLSPLNPQCLLSLEDTLFWQSRTWVGRGSRADERGLACGHHLLRPDGLMSLRSLLPPQKLVPQSCCLVLIWADLEESLLLSCSACRCTSLLLWIAWRDSHCEADAGSIPGWGSTGSYLDVWNTFPGLSLSRVTPALCAQAGQHLHIRAVLELPPSAWFYCWEWSHWEWRQMLAFLWGMGSYFTSISLFLAHEQLGRNAARAPGMPAGWPGQPPMPAAIAGGHKANASMENWKLFRLGFLNLLKTCCSLCCSWFLMDISTSNKFLVQ